MRKFLHPLWIALPCYALDQLTKQLVMRNIDFHTVREVIPGFFDLTYTVNTGAAFSVMQNRSPFFIALSAATLIALLVAWARGHFRDWLNWWGVGLLMGGILGNVTDRLLYGHVIDFLSFDLHVPYADPFATFNVADSGICVAVGLFLVATYLEGRRTPAVAK